MTYALINEQNEVLVYPLYPNSHFRDLVLPSDGDYSHIDGVVVVEDVTATNTWDQNAIPTAALIDGKWQQVWVYTSKSAEEIEQISVNQLAYIRMLRDDLLKESDYTEFSRRLSPEKKAEWLAYRDELFDFPETVTDIFNFTFPDKPSDE